MQIHKNLETYISNKSIALTQGTFDGVHKGHRSILETLKKEAKKRNLETAIITFFPHPRTVLKDKNFDIQLLDTLDEKIAKLAKLDIDHLFVIPFTTQFSETEPLDYIHDILIQKLNVKLMVIGYDHKFGINRNGNISTLIEDGNIEIIQLPAQQINEVSVSSTKIRNALHNGEVDLAMEYLDVPYSITGNVVHGNAAGKSIGFPTANLLLENDHKLIPDNGVYAIKIKLENKKFDGVVNIGNQPTFDGRKHAIEVHIFDFEDDIYNKNISIFFIKRIRAEKKFENIEKLVLQIKNDVCLARKLLNEYTNF